MLVYFDCETIGFYGFPVLLQYAVDDGPIVIYEVWKHTVQETLDLLEFFCENTMVFFNGVFDWFHANKLYNCFWLVKDRSKLPDIMEVASLQLQARDGLCLKPRDCFDVFLHARKTSYQSLMDRSDISIRRVPMQIAAELAAELERRVPLNPIYFARKADKSEPQWKVSQSKDYETREPIDGFYDVTLVFAPSSGLKALAVDALKVDPAEVRLFSDIAPAPVPLEELGYAPCWGNWPTFIQRHIDHWSSSPQARDYASRDVDYLRRLYKYFGSPPVSDDDSVLACQVAATRWKGFKINIEKLKSLLLKTKVQLGNAPTDPGTVMRWIKQVMSPAECALIHNTKKNTLKEISNWKTLKADYVCEFPELHTMEKLGYSCAELHNAPTFPHPAAERAKAVLDARTAEKEIELYEKLIFAGRFHPSFKIIGTLSGRMAGTDDLNPQGIKGAKWVRECFELAFDDEVLSGGDFTAFEITLAEADYKDPKLRQTLLSGKKIHAIFGTFLFPEYDYDEIIATDATNDNKYTLAKSGVFSLIYGGNEGTLHRKMGVSMSVAEDAYAAFVKEYPGIGVARRKVAQAFQGMQQLVPGGQVTWREPADYIESFFGFRRYFTLENRIAKALFTLAQDPPAKWRAVKTKVKRRDKLQTASGAAQSALFGAAFGIQAANVRAAMNHRIQSSGANITKAVQRNIWDLQPHGAKPWKVRPINVHDEVNVANSCDAVATEVEQVVNTKVETYREVVPLIGISWHGMLNWAEKKKVPNAGLQSTPS